MDTIINVDVFNTISNGILKNPLEENCGFILKSNEVIFCENISETKDKSFRMRTEDILEHSGNIEYIFHNHVVNPRIPPAFDPRTPSKSDILSQKNTGVKWLIFANDKQVVTPPLEVPRTRNNVYLNRPFIWFINDCFTLMSDYYYYELNIQIKESKVYELNEIRKLSGIFDNLFEEYGFKRLYNMEDLQKGDIFVIDNGGLHANHILVYDGEDSVYHQALLSKKEPLEAYVGRFKRRFRYES
jgi:hypothetical protein